MSKLLTSKRIAQVNLDERNPDSEERIAQCDTGVRKSTRIQDDEIDTIDGGLLDPVDQLMLRIALKAGQAVPQLGRQFLAACLDLLEPRATIDLGFTRTQQIEVRAIDKQEL